MESFIIFLFAVFFLAVLTLIGHGLWLLVAAILRTLFRAEEDQAPSAGGRAIPRWLKCPQCWRASGGSGRYCNWCGLDYASTKAGELADLATTAAQLDRFRAQGALDDAAWENLQKHITARRRALILAAPAATGTEPVPALAVEPAAPSIEGLTEAEQLLERLGARTSEEILEVLPAHPPLPEAVTSAAPVSAIQETTEPIPALVPATPGDRAEGVAAAPALEEPRRPRRSFTELLAGFMEERNILWGELVGGLLMVGCSIALVIYLWKTYSDFPYFPLFIFTGITASLFGTGLYALHRLRLGFTGRSLLVIATLLVPLNCLVMAGLSRSEAGDPVQIAIDGVVLALLAVLVQLAGRGLAIDRPWLLTAGVLGSSASQLLMSRFVPAAPALSTFVVLAAVPVACFSGAVAPFLLWATRQQPLSSRLARSVFEFLGCAAFALAVALGLLIYRCSDISLALERVAVLIAVAGIPVLAAGLLVHRGLAEDSEQGAFRTAGTGVALLGMAVMLLAGVLAWPQPMALLLVCGLDFVILTAVAFRFQLPAAHAAALPCVLVAYLTTFHLIAGNIEAADGPGLMRAAFSAQSGAVLVVLAVVLAGWAEGLARVPARQHAMFYAAGAAVTAGLSLALVTWRGVADPGRATVVYAVYGVGFLAANARWRRPAITGLGLALLVGTTLWALWWSTSVLTPAWGLVLAAESLLVSVLIVLIDRYRAVQLETDRRDGPPALIDLYRQPLPVTALASGLLALSLSLLAPSFPASAYFPWTAVLLGASALVLAWVYRHASLTWVGSALLLGGACLELRYVRADLDLPHPWALALLAHASVMLLASLLLRARVRGETDLSNDSRSTLLRGLFVEPLGGSALVSSLAATPLLTLPALVSAAEAQFASLAFLMTWLAVLWLVIAGIERWPGLFTAFQAALSLAVVYGVTAWLEAQGIIRSYPEDIFAPHSLQAYGVGLGCLALLWVLARVGLRSYEQAVALLEPDWPALDRVVLGGVVIGQAVLAVWGIWPDVLRELAPAGTLRAAGVWGGGHSAAYGAGGWALLGTLTVVLVAALWKRYQTGAVLGLLILAFTVPVLAAGQFAVDLAAASALRWGLAAAFLVCSVPFWLRDGIGHLAQRLGITLDPDVPLAALARPLLLCGAALPVICLTTVVALIGFSGPESAGPGPASFFTRIGWVLSNVVPMAVVSLGLVGHALRERSAGYAFAAGLVANATLTGGYALQVAHDGQLHEVEWVRLVQLSTLGTAVWGIAWLVTRPWSSAWRERSEAPLARPLMTVQLSLAAAGNGFLLAVGVWLLLFPLASGVIHLAGAWYGAPRAWTTEAGSALGWLALGLTIAAVVLRNWGSRSLLSPVPLGWLGLLLVGLLACSVERGAPGWGYRTLMVGWAGYALAWSLLAGWQQRVRRHGEEDKIAQGLSDAAALFVSSAGLLAVLLGLKAAFVHHDRLWAAAAIALASPAGALLAVQRRREHWAFTAGLGINLAASLIVWHYHVPSSLEGWWAHLLQANVIATAAGALLWLAMRRHIYGQPELSIFAGPLLAAQVTLGLAGNALLLGWPLLLLVAYPPSAGSLGQTGEAWGWLALILAFAAFLWYCDQIAPRKRAHIVVIFGLALGVLAACAVGPFDTGDWLSFHVLTAIWCMTGLLTLAAGWVGTAFRLAGSAEASDEERAALDRIARLFPADLIPRWISAIGLLVVGLALRGIDDPHRPFASAAATLTVSTLFGGLALWSCRQQYVYASGLLINLAGILIWLARREHTLVDLVSVNVICLAVASAFWSAVEWALRSSGLRLNLRDGRLPFCHLAAILAQSLLIALVAGCILSGRDFYLADSWTWGALELTALALVLTFWDAEARFTLAGLYSIGLLTAGMIVLSYGPIETYWSLCLLGTYFAAYVLLTTALRREAPLGSRLWQSLRIPARAGGWPEEWFARSQVLIAACVAGLSVWMALGFPSLGERLVGPVCVGLLVPAGVVLTSIVRGVRNESETESPKIRRSTFEDALAYGTLALGVLAVAELGWAVLERGDRTLWLYGGLTLMVALALMTPVYGIGLSRLLPAQNPWAEVGRKLGPRLGALATVMLVVVLLQEGAFYNPLLKRTPMATPAVLIMVGALLILMVASISFAVAPGRDPFRLTERGRMLYVYACELLLVFLFLHLKLTRPEWFGTFGAKYWTFLIMALAFLGVGLGELFQRRGLHVLAEPLQRTGVFLPLLPLLAFWTRRLAPAELIGAVGQRAPAMRPLLDYIDPTIGTRIGFDQYAMLWGMAAALLTFIAVLQRSFRYSLLAALAANFGWWSLLVHYTDVGLAFMVHPQLWLIPLALIALAAEYLNRDRLTPQQSGTLRYLSLLVIYVSSTADMFIAGLGESVYLPLLLAVLSVAGVLSGILLRVRAFLFLGVTFLFLVVFTMIWHAAVGRQQYWVWWVSGILLGGGIIALFALFEKRRNEVLQMVDELKSWK